MYYEYLQEMGRQYGMQKRASLQKRAGDLDTWGGNAVAALVPFGTIDKVKERGEGAGGYIGRSVAHGVGGLGGTALGVLPFIPALKKEKVDMFGGNMSPKAKKLLLGLNLASMVTGAGGAVVGDRVADAVL